MFPLKFWALVAVVVALLEGRRDADLVRCRHLDKLRG